jgi:hypothetical protein
VVTTKIVIEAPKVTAESVVDREEAKLAALEKAYNAYCQREVDEAKIARLEASGYFEQWDDDVTVVRAPRPRLIRSRPRERRARTTRRSRAAAGGPPSDDDGPAPPPPPLGGHHRAPSLGFEAAIA